MLEPLLCDLYVIVKSFRPLANKAVVRVSQGEILSYCKIFEELCFVLCDLVVRVQDLLQGQVTLMSPSDDGLADLFPL